MITLLRNFWQVAAKSSIIFQKLAEYQTQTKGLLEFWNRSKCVREMVPEICFSTKIIFGKNRNFKAGGVRLDVGCRDISGHYFS